MQGRGPSNISLASLFASLMFAGLHNQSTLLTKLEVTQTVFLAYKHLSSSTVLRNSLADETSGGFSSTKGGTICINRGWIGFLKSSDKSSRTLAFFPSSMFIARYGRMTQRE